jgi:cytochrome c
LKELAMILAVILIMPATVLMAGENEADVKELVNSAVTFFQDKGQDYSIKTFNALHGPFVKGPLYVFAATFDGTMLAHPMKKDLVDKSLLDVKDSNGKLLFQEMVKVAKTDGEGWVDYAWPYPGTNEPSPKRTYIKRIPSQNVWVAAGYYVK